jgi:hypothetical protein
MLPSDESAKLTQELVRMLEDADDFDAYRLARFLDGAGWEVDEQLVEILREVPWLINRYRSINAPTT